MRHGAHTGLFDFLRARFGGDWSGYDPDRDRVPTASPAALPSGERSSNAAVTWIGHASVLIQHRGVNVLTDPMFSTYASPVQFAGPRRITDPALSANELPPVDVVVISHDHYDHLDVDSIAALGNTPRYFVPPGIGDWLADRGIDQARITELDWWQTDTVSIRGESVRVTATPSQHFSGRGLADRDRRLWASWAVEWPDFTAWYAGDTGYNDVQFKSIGERIARIDLGIIPIGAYAPRWFMRTVHVNPEEAVAIHEDVGATRSMGVHWGTFVLSGEGVMAPPAALADAVSGAGLPADAFTVFAVGETRRY